MIKIDIPGYKKIRVEHLVLDYNGTLAVDGKLIQGSIELLRELSKNLTIHIITADTFGSVKKEFSDLKWKYKILKPFNQGSQKKKYLTSLGKKNVVSIGNGHNDQKMLLHAGLSIMVIQQEGAYAGLSSDVDIVCLSIIDALNLLLNPLRIVATLRK